MNRRVRSVLLNILFFAICVALAYGLSRFMFTSIEVKGISMEPTLHDKDDILLFKPGKYKYGDIVVLNTHKITADGEQHLVKRIIGMPGDVIEIIKDEADGNFYVWRNGLKLEEEYINPDCPMNAEMARITVGEGEFLYMGDNRGVSVDSRQDGTLGKLDDIVGRVILRYVIGGGDWDINAIRRVS